MMRTQQRPVPLAGRDPELRAIDGWVESADGGEGAFLLLAGESGIGKSRLARELIARARSRGFEVVLAHCYPEDAGVPFAPFAALPDGDRGAAAEAIRSLGAPAGTERDFALALASTIEGVAASMPVCLVVEDLHWSDEGTLAALLRLARRAGRLRLLVACTYRPAEASDSLDTFIAGINREPVAHELELRPLASAAVANLAQSILQAPRAPRREFAAELQALTDGNPLFVVEVLETLLATGAIDITAGDWDRRALAGLEPPRAIRHAVQRRLRGLSEGAIELLSVASVVGRGFSYELVRRLLDLQESTALALIREALAAQLLVERPDGALEFQHALTRDAVYAGLLVREREVLHARLAEMLLASAKDGHQPLPGDIARHLFAAGRLDEAQRWSLEAARVARTMGSPRAVLYHLERAAEAGARIGGAPQGFEALRWRAEAADTVGDFERARMDYEAALALADEAGEDIVAWELVRALGMLWASRDYSRSLPWYEQAMVRADEIGDPVLRVRSVNHLGNWQSNAGDPQEAVRLHRQACSLAETIEDRAPLAETYDFLAMACAMAGSMSDAVEMMERAISLYEELGDDLALASLLASLGTLDGGSPDSWVCPYPAPSERPARAARRALELARALDWRSGEAYALVGLAGADAAHGRMAQAGTEADLALAIARDIEHSQWTVAALLAQSTVAQELRLLEEARERLLEARQLAREVRSRYWEELAALALAALEVEAGEGAKAETLLDEVDSRGGRPQALVGALSKLLRAEVALGKGSPEAAIEALDELRAMTGDRVVVPRTWRVRALARAASGDRDDAVTLLNDAVDAAAARGWLHEELRCVVTLADILVSAGELEGAEPVAVHARILREQVAASLPDPAERAQYLQRLPRASLERGAHQEVSSSNHGPRLGLTARELDVLRLVVDGLSNAQIADTLVIDRRTVETHIGHLFRKVGVTSRSQLIRRALDREVGRLA